jgi:hypothetical protein
VDVAPAFEGLAAFACGALSAGWAAVGVFGFSAQAKETSESKATARTT